MMTIQPGIGFLSGLIVKNCLIISLLKPTDIMSIRTSHKITLDNTPMAISLNSIHMDYSEKVIIISL